MARFQSAKLANGFNPDFAIGARTEANEDEAFLTKKAKAYRCIRLSFFRKKKSGIVRRIPRPIANSGFNIQNQAAFRDWIVMRMFSGASFLRRGGGGFGS